MRVKKALSKRKSTKLVKGIEKKVAAHTRKQKKSAKKDITWKSKHSKDPGIPNSFPYKARLLEEIEQQKIADELEREERRKRQREQALMRGGSEEQVTEEIEALDAQANSNRLQALMASAQQAADEYENGDNDIDMSEDEEEEIDFSGELDYSGKYAAHTSEGSRKAFDKVFKEVLDFSDVILYVLDSRNPEATRSRKLEAEILANSQKRLIYVLNKIDLIPSDVLQRWRAYLELFFPTVPIIASSSASNAKTFQHGPLTQVSSSNGLLQVLKKFASKSNLKRSINVGIIGYPNVGKSSVINALLSRHGNTKTACPVGAQAGVTTSIRKVKIDNKLSLLDSPGIVFPSSDSKPKNVVDLQARLILLGAVPPKKIDDPRPAVSLLIKRLCKNEKQLEMLNNYYDIPPIVSTPHDEYVTGILVHVARRLGRLKKGGIPDLEGAAASMLADWRDGRICGWSSPPSAETIQEQTEKRKIPQLSGDSSEQKKIVTEWKQEFDLGGLWDEAFTGAQ